MIYFSGITGLVCELCFLCTVLVLFHRGIIFPIEEGHAVTASFIIIVLYVISNVIMGPL